MHQYRGVLPSPDDSLSVVRRGVGGEAVWSTHAYHNRTSR